MSTILPDVRIIEDNVRKHLQEKRYYVAESVCKLAMKELETTHGHSHWNVARMQTALTTVYRTQGKDDLALKLLKDTLRIYQKLLSEHDLESITSTIMNLALLTASEVTSDSDSKQESEVAQESESDSDNQSEDDKGNLSQSTETKDSS